MQFEESVVAAAGGETATSLTLRMLDSGTTPRLFKVASASLNDFNTKVLAS